MKQRLNNCYQCVISCCSSCLVRLAVFHCCRSVDVNTETYCSCLLIAYSRSVNLISFFFLCHILVNRDLQHPRGDLTAYAGFLHKSANVQKINFLKSHNCCKKYENKCSVLKQATVRCLIRYHFSYWLTTLSLWPKQQFCHNENNREC